MTAFGSSDVEAVGWVLLPVETPARSRTLPFSLITLTSLNVLSQLCQTNNLRAVCAKDA
jgi:hypothetical protein